MKVRTQDIAIFWVFNAIAIFRRTHYFPIHFKCQKRRQCSWLNQIIACYKEKFFLNAKSYTLFTNGERNGKAHNTIALLKVSFGKSYSILLSQWDSSRCNFIGQCWLVLRSKGWLDKQSTALHRMEVFFFACRNVILDCTHEKGADKEPFSKYFWTGYNLALLV